ncbi:MAG: PTS sugar transporter subunit IIC [Desulfonatronovibrio sp.]
MNGKSTGFEYSLGCNGGRFFFALFSLSRFSINIGLIERPIVVGFFIALLTGEVFPVMYIAAFFELLWIDIIPAGTFIPPNAIFCVVATVILVEIFALEPASQIFPVMVATIPLAFLSSWLEGTQRTAQNRNYNIILQQSRKTGDNYRPGAMIKASVLHLLLIYLVLGTTGIYTLVLLLNIIHVYLPVNNDLSWSHLLLTASLSALAALRIKKAYISLILGITAISAGFLLFSNWP